MLGNGVTLATLLNFVHTLVFKFKHREYTAQANMEEFFDFFRRPMVRRARCNTSMAVALAVRSEISLFCSHITCIFIR